MKRVLFVDDEVKVLDGLRRMLRKLRRQWEMEFAPGGAEALELLDARPCDVVVSDMRMPGMDGSQLLREVMQRHPSTVRMILSGQCDRAAVMKAVGPAHQFLSKPCDAETLKATVGRACRLRDELDDDILRSTVSCVGSLPSLPDVYHALREELSQDNPSPAAVGRLVDADPALTARLLQLVSSSFFGSPRRVASAAEAAELLGVEILRCLFEQTEVFRPAEPGSREERMLRRVVEHSRAVAQSAQAIAQAESDDKRLAADAFLAGWLHEIGSLVMLTRFPSRYGDLFDRSQCSETSLTETETAAYGNSRHAVGAYLLGLWGLPDWIVRAVAYHACPCRNGAAPAAEEQLGRAATPLPEEHGTSGGFTALTALHAAHALVCAEQPCCGLAEQLDLEYLERLGCADRVVRWQEICARQLTTGVM